jgi:hypothetical protein
MLDTQTEVDSTRTTNISEGEVTYLIDFMNQLQEAVEVPDYIKEEVEKAGEMLEGWLESILITRGG